MQKEKTPIYRNTGLALASHALNRRQESDAALRALIGTTRQGSVAYQGAEVHAYHTPSHVMRKQWGIEKAEMVRRHIVFQDEDKDTYVSTLLAASTSDE